MFKPKIGRNYIVTKIIDGHSKSQYVKIDSKCDNKSIKSIKCMKIIINRLNQKDTNSLPNEIWDYIFKMVKQENIYGYYYGNFGYHEGYCLQSEIRELNTKEFNDSNNGKKYWILPQQFYQSFPSY